MSPAERRRSIRLRLALASAAMAAMLVGITVTAVYFSTEEIIEDEVDEDLEGELAELANLYRERGLAEFAREIQRRSSGLAAHRGYYFFSEERLQRISGNLDEWPEQADHETTWTECKTLTLEESGDRYKMVRKVRMGAIVFDDGRHLIVGRDITYTDTVRRALGFAGAASFGAAVLIALIGGLTVSRGLLRRVEGMNRTILSILEGGRRELVPVGERPDEFDELAHHFNHLLAENERLIERMRQFSNDVAHDLRTPLSRMRAVVESALAHPDDSERSRDALHALLGETNELLETFNALLRIAQIESRTLREQMKPVDLRDLARDAVELYQPVAEEAGLALESSLDQEVTIHGDRHLLAQALTNLLDNAIKYGGEAIEVAVERDANGPRLVVSDAGPGIPEADREQVLERFVRLDASRNQAGIGLGLSFVKAVADLHAARLVLDDARPGLRATLHFPAARTDASGRVAR